MTETDIDALARRIAAVVSDAAAKVRTRLEGELGPKGDLQTLARLVNVQAWALAWLYDEIAATGFSEGFAAGAQAMRGAAANYVTLKYGAALISIDIRALPLPDEKEKP